MTPTRISPEVLNGVFALSGAIVGALIGGIPSYLLERRRDRREERREKKARLTSVKQAARVVDAELEQAGRSTQISVDRGEWWAKEIGPLDVGSWNQYRAILASELPLDEWRLIASAFGFIHGINSAWAIAFRPPDIARYKALSLDPPRGGEPMSKDDRKRIPYAIGWITKARLCIAKLLPDEPEKGKKAEKLWDGFVSIFPRGNVASEPFTSGSVPLFHGVVSINLGWFTASRNVFFDDPHEPKQTTSSAGRTSVRRPHVVWGLQDPPIHRTRRFSAQPRRQLLLGAASHP